MEPAFIDQPYQRSEAFFKQLRAQYPKTKVICSYHDYTGVLDSIEFIYSKPADLYKVACFPKSVEQTLRFMIQPKKTNTTLVAMGPYGQSSRILAPYFGSLFSYLPLNQDHITAPGQLLLKELTMYQTVNQNGAIFALLGSPITQSPGVLVHNRVFKKLQINAVYLSLDLQKHELGSVIALMQKLRCVGLSVTTPYKEAVLPYLTQKSLQPVNTILFHDNQVLGFNTDVLALEGFLKQRRCQRVLILGSGGCAKAFALWLNRKRFSVFIAARNKTQRDAIECKWSYDLDHITGDYDCVINTTGTYIPFSFKPSMFVIDLTLDDQRWIKQACAQGCDTVDGFEFFLSQAKWQHRIWSSYYDR